MAMHQIELGEGFSLILSCEERLLDLPKDAPDDSPGDLVLFLHGLG
ncbi:MAG: hypothetical protein ISR48_00960, partial [Alphaproteobacteria bacterium]|nr:hypothetical protein [Alphaproteobacteria bacterium]